MKGFHRRQAPTKLAKAFFRKIMERSVRFSAPAIAPNALFELVFFCVDVSKLGGWRVDLGALPSNCWEMAEHRAFWTTLIKLVT